jgi:hypothetical protein
MHHSVCHVLIHCSRCTYGREPPSAKLICEWFIQVKETESVLKQNFIRMTTDFSRGC